VCIEAVVADDASEISIYPTALVYGQHSVTGDDYPQSLTAASLTVSSSCPGLQGQVG